MGRIIFNSFNPYEAAYPNRKTISRPALDLMKKLRIEGHEVLVSPIDNHKLEYLAQKGFIEDILSDPLVLQATGISISILTGLFTNWLYDKFKSPKRKHNKARSTQLIIELDEDGRRFRYSQIGEPISDEKFESLLYTMKERQRAYKKARLHPTPNDELIVPIFLEHSFKIVGWSGISMTDQGLLADPPAQVFDVETKKRISNGELNGFSIGGIVSASECLICHKDYTECNHIAGEIYNGKKCVVEITSIQLCDVSIVQEPVNPGTRIVISDRGEV